MKIVDFKTTNYFQGTAMFFGGVLIFTSILLFASTIITSIILLLISIIIFTTHYRLKIDLDKKVFHEHVWILGIKNGDKENFETIEYLFIKKSSVSQTMRLKVASSTIKKEVYDAYLRFSETQKVHLLTEDNKKNIVEKLGPIARNLNIMMIDYTEGPEKVL
jgi:hypothetical protein